MSTNSDAFRILRQLTHARVGLGRAGDGLPTRVMLEFQMAHALARDAVHGSTDFDQIASALKPRDIIKVKSAVDGRLTYLRRPDLGRRLAEGEAAKLPTGPFDLVFVIADGLAAKAAEHYAPAVVSAAMANLKGLTIGPVIFAAQARVALGDDIGNAMRARLVAVLIGERPGLSTTDSLGIYLTYKPRAGTGNSARNCISNIHCHGLTPEQAAHRLAWLAREALRLGVTGIELKEAAPDGALEGRASACALVEETGGTFSDRIYQLPPPKE